jgi:uncharacterized protein (TIGR02172 family)
MKDISSSNPIARGRTADVYDWDEGQVLKLFNDWFRLEDIEYELKIASAVHASGVKTPAVLELVQVEGRNGLVYERVRGESMLRMFQRKPWMVFTYARILARLHTEMHECVFETDIPHQHAKLRYKLDHTDVLPASTKSSILKALASLPEGNRVCHGDFHPANVLMNGSDATIIDWIDASCGNPLADVARTSIILLGATASSQVANPLLKLFVQAFHSIYLREYFRLRPQGRDEYHRWLPIVAGARLSEGMPELEKWLVEQAGK